MESDFSGDDLRLTGKPVGLINFEKPNLDLFVLVFGELVA
jgi:hypothetical protein